MAALTSEVPAPRRRPPRRPPSAGPGLTVPVLVPSSEHPSRRPLHGWLHPLVRKSTLSRNLGGKQSGLRTAQSRSPLRHRRSRTSGTGPQTCPSSGRGHGQVSLDSVISMLGTAPFLPRQSPVRVQTALPAFLGSKKFGAVWQSVCRPLRDSTKLATLCVLPNWWLCLQPCFKFVSASV